MCEIRVRFRVRAERHTPNNEQDQRGSDAMNMHMQSSSEVHADSVSGELQWSLEQQVKELKRRMDASKSDMDYKQQTFKPNPDDVIVAVPPKNGTTWLMHICHQIRVKGQEPDFEDQLDVITWIEASERVYGYKPADKPQPARPHVFVTHLPCSLVPAGGKLIYCFRDPKDALLSAYHFYDSKLSLRNRVCMEVFADTFIPLEVEKHLRDLLMWWERRHDDSVLFLFFDNLKEDHGGCVCRIAKFMCVDCDEDEIARVVHTTSHAEMCRHHSKFSSRRHTLIVAERIREVPPSQSEFVGRVRREGGKSGEGAQTLPLSVQKRIDQLWHEIVTVNLGFADLAKGYA